MFEFKRAKKRLQDTYAPLKGTEGFPKLFEEVGGDDIDLSSIDANRSSDDDASDSVDARAKKDELVAKARSTSGTGSLQRPRRRRGCNS